MAKRDLINITDFSIEELESMMRLADNIAAHPDVYAEDCKGKSWRLFSMSRVRGHGSVLSRPCWSSAAR